MQESTLKPFWNLKEVYGAFGAGSVKGWDYTVAINERGGMNENEFQKYIIIEGTFLITCVKTASVIPEAPHLTGVHFDQKWHFTSILAIF